MIPEQDPQYGRWEVTVGPEGVSDRTPTGHSTTLWSAIDGVQLDPNHLFIQRGRLNAFIVPTAAFESPAALEEFASTVATHAGRDIERFDSVARPPRKRERFPWHWRW